MNMTLKQKFLILTGLIGVLLAIVSIVGYLSARDNLSKSVDNELTAVVTSQANLLDGWLVGSKKKVHLLSTNPISSASLMATRRDLKIAII